jgi:hypothetical protein
MVGPTSTGNNKGQCVACEVAAIIPVIDPQDAELERTTIGRCFVGRELIAIVLKQKNGATSGAVSVAERAKYPNCSQTSHSLQ